MSTDKPVNYGTEAHPCSVPPPSAALTSKTRLSASELAGEIANLERLRLNPTGLSTREAYVLLALYELSNRRAADGIQPVKTPQPASQEVVSLLIQAADSVVEYERQRTPDESWWTATYRRLSKAVAAAKNQSSHETSDDDTYKRGFKDGFEAAQVARLVQPASCVTPLASEAAIATSEREGVSNRDN